MSFVVVDLETTGLSKTRDRITEIAGIKVEGGRVLDEFQTLVNPEVRIPPFITHLTGIDDDMVNDAPTADIAVADFLDFLGDATFVAHNAAFDYGFVSQAAVENELKFRNRRLCARKLANRLVPHLRTKRLAALCDYYGVVNTREHRAMADARAALCVFNNFLARMRRMGVSEFDDVIRFERLSKRAVFDKYGTPW